MKEVDIVQWLLENKELKKVPAGMTFEFFDGLKIVNDTGRDHFIYVLTEVE